MWGLPVSVGCWGWRPPCCFRSTPNPTPTPPQTSRHLADGLGSLGNPIGSPLDKLRVGLFRLKSLLGSLDDLLAAPETTTLQRLQVGGCLKAGATLDRGTD